MYKQKAAFKSDGYTCFNKFRNVEEKKVKGIVIDHLKLIAAWLNSTDDES